MGVVVVVAIAVPVPLAAAPGAGLAAPDQMELYRVVLFLQPLAVVVAHLTCLGHHPQLVQVVVPGVVLVD
jgi:hypothetical protein